MNSILAEVKGLLPNVLDNKLPDMTGPSIPTPPAGVGLSKPPLKF